MWKEIKDFDAYLINEFGEVKSKKTNKILIGGSDRNGYKCVNLRANKKSYFRPRHRLVAIAFLPLINGKECVNHKDANKENNHFLNLEWCNYQENNTHMKMRSGKYSKLPGVSYCKTRNKFSSSLKVNSKHNFLGRFDTEQEAHQAYIKALKFHGIENKYATSNHSI
jgi:hypothetical protein